MKGSMYQAILNCFGYKERLTTVDISKMVDLSTGVVASVLESLQEEGKVILVTEFDSTLLKGMYFWRLR